MLRPSKRLKKQQTAALQALQQQQQNAINSNGGGGVLPTDGRSFVDANEQLSTAAKLKSALIGKPMDAASFQPLLQQTLFQQSMASQPNPIHSLTQPATDLTTSNLMKRLQAKEGLNQ